MKKLTVLLILITLSSLSCTDTLMDVVVDYKIDSIEDLARLEDSSFGNSVASAVKSPVFYLTGNIDASDTVTWNEGEGWKGITIPENVILDGRGYTIDGITTNGSTNPCGFIESNQGLVRDLHLTNLTITGTINFNAYGAFANTNTGTITRCSITGLSGGESGADRLNGAGFVSYNQGTITNCFTRGVMTGEASWGFVKTNSTGAQVVNCYSVTTITANYSGTNYGFDGLVVDEGPITNSYFYCVSSGGMGLAASDATSLTEAELQDETNFPITASTWDFTTIWSITDGSYPELRTPAP